MLNGWSDQKLSRNLSADTIADRLALVRRFQNFTCASDASRVDCRKVDFARGHHGRPGAPHVGGRHANCGLMMNRCTDEFGKEEVGRLFVRDAHGVVKARPRIEYDEAVRWRPEHPVERSRRVLEPPRKRP